jgi:hypothetical protein
MRVLAHQREGEFVGLRLADELRAGVQNHLHGGGGFFRRLCSLIQLRVAAAGFVAGYIENVLHRQPQSRQRAGFRMRNRHLRQIEESVEGIARGSHRSPWEYNPFTIVRPSNFYKLQCDFY